MKIKETNLKFTKPLTLRKFTNYFMIHYAGPTGTMDITKIGADIVHDWHLKRDWYGCGYHYIVKRNGSIERGRHHRYIGCHCAGSNWETIGILVVINDDILPTKKQNESLIWLLAELGRIYHKLVVIGHKDRNNASKCPGWLLYNHLPVIAFNARMLLNKNKTL